MIRATTSMEERLELFPSADADAHVLLTRGTLGIKKARSENLTEFSDLALCLWAILGSNQ